MDARTSSWWMAVAIGAAVAVAPSTGSGESPELEPAEFRAKLSGYFRAESDVEDTDALGGFAPSSNASKAIDDEVRSSSGVFLQVDPDDERAFEPICQQGRYRGMTVRLVNRSDELVWFEAVDSRLSIVQEAKDDRGDWRSLERGPSSWCGNSYHEVALKPGRYWAFSAPRYSGPVETELRIRMKREGEPDLVSRTFTGSVHPRQYRRNWVRKERRVRVSTRRTAVSPEKSLAGADVLPRRNRRALHECYRTHVAEEETPAGSVTIRLTVDDGGDVVVASTSSTDLDRPGVEMCLSERMRTWAFPRRTDDPSIATVDYTFAFDAEIVKYGYCGALPD